MLTGGTLIRHVLTLFTVVVALGWTASADSVLVRLKARYDRISTITGSFTQRICQDAAGSCQEFTGRFAVRRPNYFRLDATAPDPQTIISDGKTLWLYLPTIKKAYQRSLATELFFFSPFQVLDDYARKYHLTLDPPQDDLVMVTLQPRAREAPFRELRIGIDTVDNSLRRLAVVDRAGNESSFDLDSLRYGLPLGRSRFRFTPPAGVEVLDFERLGAAD